MNQAYYFKIIFTFLGLLYFYESFGNKQLRLFFLKNKAHNSYSLKSPEEFLSESAIFRRKKQNIPFIEQDLPVSPFYIKKIEKKGALIIYTSKWLNAVLVQADKEVLNNLKQLDFIIPTPLKKGILKRQEEIYSSQIIDHKIDTKTQIRSLGIEKMHKKGYFGQNIHIAVFDGGFIGTNKIDALRHLFSKKLLKNKFDFVRKKDNIFQYSQHGTGVLSILASFDVPNLIGTAPLAYYSLFITEAVEYESHFEEFYWLLAAEKSDSLGVDIINSSLGYNTFDNEDESYQIGDLDGHSALISMAANWAARTGMLIVNSCGNVSDRSWPQILFPADSDSVLSVGAVDKENKHAYFSAIGPTADGRIKPDVVALGVNVALFSKYNKLEISSGTSFSAPLITGLAAGLWQQYPFLNNLQLIEYIKTSSSNPNPDNKIGHGLPSYRQASKLIKKKISSKKLKNY